MQNYMHSLTSISGVAVVLIYQTKLFSTRKLIDRLTYKIVRIKSTKFRLFYIFENLKPKNQPAQKTRGIFQVKGQ